jgi:hypothetical protein
MNFRLTFPMLGTRYLAQKHFTLLVWVYLAYDKISENKRACHL